MRLVSLCPSTTETLIALGRADALVGITKFCIHPEDIVAGIEKVGGTKNPKVERILELAPDLVFVNEEENRREDYEALSARLPVEVSFPQRADEIPAHLRRIGALIGAEAAAERHAQALESELAALAAKRRPRAFRYAYLIWKKPFMAAGAPTYVDDLIGRAGGVNVFAEAPERYPEVDLTTVQPEPDVILLPDEPFPFSEQHVPEVQALAPQSRVHLVSGDDLCWHGVRTLRGVQWLRRFLSRFDEEPA
ncbi:MAG: helical backbone metal receptor [Myxococcota bacterium]